MGQPWQQGLKPRPQAGGMGQASHGGGPREVGGGVFLWTLPSAELVPRQAEDLTQHSFFIWGLVTCPRSGPQASVTMAFTHE